MMTGRNRGASSMRSLRRILSILLAAVMVLALLPPAGVMAAGASIKIENLFVSTSKPSDTDDRVDRFSLNGITLEATVEGINPDQVPNLYYEITNVNTGISSTNRGNPAALSNNGYTVTFDSVQLTEGLNRIVIKLDGVSVISSQPAWAYYTPATRIEGLQINGSEFIEGRLYPENMNGNVWSSLVELSGYAYNTSEVSVQLHGDSRMYPAAVFGNRFSVIADREDGSANANFRLKPGDNLFTITANNPTHSYQVQRVLTYDNGDSFAYDVSLSGDDLITSPTIVQDDAVTQLLLDAKLKVDITNPDTDALKYHEVLVRVGNFTRTYDLSAMIADPLLSKTDRYNVYVIDDLAIDVGLLPADARYHEVSFVFRNMLNQDTATHGYLGFYYVNPNRAYIEYVSRKTGIADEIGTRISQAAITEVSEQPITFFVQGDSRLTGVNVYMSDYSPGDTPVEIGTIDVDDPSRFSFELEGIRSGRQKLIIVPVDATGENEAGKLEYYLQVNTAPYTIFNNVHNGMVIEDLAELELPAADCVVGGPCIAVAGRLVNVPQAEVPHVKVFLNSVDITGSFRADVTTKKFNILISSDETAANSLKEGRNMLSVELYLNNMRTATSTVEIFKFTHAAPEIASVLIDQDSTNPTFTEGTVPGTYFTSEDNVVLYGSIANVDEISLRVLRTNENGQLLTLYDLYKDATDSGNFSRQTGTAANPISNAVLFDSDTMRSNSFRTEPILLTGRGDTTIELFVTNSETNITVTQTIIITRNANPYTIVYPQTYMRQGLPHANINSNYSVIEIRAEYADQVIYGKNESAVYDDDDDVFRFEALDLDAGVNEIEFTILTGQEPIEGTLVLINMNQPTVGAQYKSKLSGRSIEAFDDQIELAFPRGTSLMRKGGDGFPNTYMTNDRQILLGIANELNGEVDPIRDSAMASVLPVFSNRDARFQTASELYWIDAGIIRWNADLNEAYTGSGQLPQTGLYYMIRQQADLVVPTQRGELTIQYDEHIVDDAWRYLTVYQYNILEDKNGVPAGRWVNLGGVVDPKKKTITVPIDSFGYFQVMYMDQSFDDVIVHNWAKNELDTMFAKGYMEPKSPPSNFVPNDPITRGEFITLLVKLYADVYPLNYKGDPTFSDVFWNNSASTAGMYDYRYIETAARAGIVRGTGGGRFNPGQTITREDAAAMIARTANLKLDTNETKVLNNLQKSFTDGAAVKYYQRSSVEAVTRAGLITGKPHSVVGNEKQTYYFDPLAPLTRADAAAIAIRILKNEKKIPK